jgi:UPF0755 protein
MIEKIRSRRWLVVVISLLTVLLLAAGLAGIWVQRQLDPPGQAGAEVTIEIPEGTSTTGIARLLETEGVITSSRVFRWYVRIRGGGGFQAGRYTLQENMAMADVIDALGDGPELAFDRVTVPEGFTLDQIIERVGAVPRFSADAFGAAASSGEIRSVFQPPDVDVLEGLLFPDTYQVDETEDERALLARMVAQLDQVATELGYEDAAGRVGLSPYETIIVASLIEREARVPEDRTKISRVIHNRLAEGMRLQIDATVLYALGEHKNRVLFRDLEVDSPYNTYRITGLPPTPIAVPGRAALKAAISPEAGPWLYYVVIEDTGAHAFAATAAEHQANIREAERRGVR